MTNELIAWSQVWGIPAEAIADLAARLTVAVSHHSDTPEARVQEAVRLRAAEMGMTLFRNNLGVAFDAHGVRRIRYGLANDSERVNRVVKSSDLIGIRELVVTPEMVGSTVGQFAAVECKAARGGRIDPAQEAWRLLVLARGGYAKIVTGADQL